MSAKKFQSAIDFDLSAVDLSNEAAECTGILFVDSSSESGERPAKSSRIETILRNCVTDDNSQLSRQFIGQFLPIIDREMENSASERQRISGESHQYDELGKEQTESNVEKTNEKNAEGVAEFMKENQERRKSAGTDALPKKDNPEVESIKGAILLNPFHSASNSAISKDHSSISTNSDCSTIATQDSHLNATSSALSGDELSFAISRIETLEEELRRARLELLEKNEKCNSLIKLQSKVDNEVQELTGALFQEAYRMVNTAEERSQNAERLLAEARLKVDVLESEVLGLKQMIKDTSKNSRRGGTTPTSASKSSIMRFLNNSLSAKSTDLSLANVNNFNKKSNLSSTPLKPATLPKSASHRSFANGGSLIIGKSTPLITSTDANEIDPIYYKEFTTWRENALGFDENCAFLRRVIREDVEPCFVFENTEFSNRVLSAVKENTLEMEPFASSTEDNGTISNNFRECSLLNVKRTCPYRLRVSSDSEWHFISLLARNRIAAVCDFFTYIRYLYQGIIKPSANDSYWCIVNLRKNMALAKLGLHFVLKMNGGGNFGAISSPDGGPPSASPEE